jgi:hypothetical protein
VSVGHGTCGAKTRAPDGHPCRLPAGAGTGSRYGRCRFHGGATSAGQKNAAMLEAKAQAARLGTEVSLDPADALALTVRLATGEVEWLRGRIAQVEADDPAANLDALAGALASANERLARISKLASDANVDERRLQLDALVVDRLGAAVTAAIEDARLDEDARARLGTALHHRLGELTDDDLRPRPKALTS